MERRRRRKSTLPSLSNHSSHLLFHSITCSRSRTELATSQPTQQKCLEEKESPRECVWLDGSTTIENLSLALSFLISKPFRVIESLQRLFFRIIFHFVCDNQSQVSNIQKRAKFHSLSTTNTLFLVLLTC